MVVFVAELVEQDLEIYDGGGLVRLGSQPVLQGLLEALDFAAGGRMVWATVLLNDAHPNQ